MTPDRLHKLTARRDDVQAALLELLAIPAANRLRPRGGKSAWPEEIKSCESLLKTLDASIAQLRPRPVETKPKRRRAVPPEQLDRREIARIAQDEQTSCVCRSCCRQPASVAASAWLTCACSTWPSRRPAGPHRRAA